MRDKIMGLLCKHHVSFENLTKSLIEKASVNLKIVPRLGQL